jgi:hypothetical protein
MQWPSLTGLAATPSFNSTAMVVRGEYFIAHHGRFYDSKAIIGVAFAYQHKGARPLRYNDFGGGEATVEPQLRMLRFKIRHRSSLPAADRARLDDREGGDEDGPPPSSAMDAKRRVLAFVARRLGQPKFRRALLGAYERRCAITGDAVEPVLEAAHIEPYRLRGLNAVTNGLLLRADLHTLFDVGLIAVDQDDTLLVSKALDKTAYAKLRGKALRSPRSAGHRPSKVALAAHRASSKAG